jgi:hypothetical protein
MKLYTRSFTLRACPATAGRVRGVCPASLACQRQPRRAWHDPAPRASTRHFLIGHAAIKNARISPENNALHFSNRLKTAICSTRFSRVSAPPPRLIHRSSLITHNRLTRFLFNTNKTNRIIIPTRAPLKTKDKRFSIPHKSAYRGTGNPACALRFCIVPLRRDTSRQLSVCRASKQQQIPVRILDDEIPGAPRLLFQRLVKGNTSGPKLKKKQLDLFRCGDGHRY